MELLHERQGADHVIRHPLGIKMVFSRLHESHEDLSALLRVSTEDFAGWQDGDLFDGKIILTGPNSKAAIVKHCGSRIGSFPDWAGLLEKACILVRLHHEEGSPVYDLAEGDIQPEPPWLISPLFRMNEPAILFGAGGTGKSTIALAFAAMLASGMPRWDLEICDWPQRVLYLDYEDDIENFRRRLALIADGLGIPRPQVFYKRGEASLPSMVDSFARQLAQLEIDGIIVDSAALACGSEPEKADTANAYFRAVRLLGVKWSLHVGHQPKDKDKSPMPFGSVFWWNNARTIVHAVGQEDFAHGGARVGLEVVKANHGRKGAVLGFSVKHTAQAIEIEQIDGKVRSMIDDREKARALEALHGAGCPLRVQTWADISGIVRRNLDSYITRLMKDGEIRRTARGLYEPARPRQVEPPVPRAFHEAFEPTERDEPTEPF